MPDLPTIGIDRSEQRSLERRTPSTKGGHARENTQAIMLLNQSSIALQLRLNPIDDFGVDRLFNREKSVR